MAEQDNMKIKLREYLNTVLADAPAGARTEELRAELYQNMCDKYDDLIAEGRTPAAAYNAAVTGLGDVTPLLADLTARPATTLVGDRDDVEPDPHAGQGSEARREAMRRYRKRSAILIPVAVALYILSVIPCILLERTNDDLGAVCMFAIVAIATGILIFNHMSKPLGASPAPASPADDGREQTDDASPRQKVYKAISGALWIITVLIYLGISFLTMRWTVTWLIFLVAVAVDNIVKALFDLTE